MMAKKKERDTVDIVFKCRECDTPCTYAYEFPADGIIPLSMEAPNCCGMQSVKEDHGDKSCWVRQK